MATDPLDMWPEGLQVTPYTPHQRLRMLAAGLPARTSGRLTAEVVSDAGPPDDPGDAPSGKESVHRLEIIAPRLSGYRHQLLVCRHDAKFVYPVQFEDREFLGLTPTEATAASQNEFDLALRKVLGSKKTVGLLNSLLARIAEVEAVPSPA